MDFSKLIDFLKLSPRYLIPISIASGIILFASDRFIDTIGLLEIRQDYRTWIGPIFLVTSIIVVLNPIYQVAEILADRVRTEVVLRSHRADLHQLTPAEKEILRGYILEDTQTRTLDFTDGVVAGLVSKRVIYRATSASFLGPHFAYNIYPWAWKYLREHPELLD